MNSGEHFRIVFTRPTVVAKSLLDLVQGINV